LLARGIYDNMKTAVDRVTKGKGRVVNARFSALCSHYLFDAEFCNVASGWEKGVVEKNVQDSRRRIWHGSKCDCVGVKCDCVGVRSCFLRLRGGRSCFVLHQGKAKDKT
jgi:hypothetical protein